MDRSSLFYWVFSAKYFPSRSIFDAKVASGSYAWQSIAKARNLVQTSLLWSVGNGRKINIYGDRWLLGGDLACILSLRNGVASNWEVAKLLVARGEGWNDQLVETLFLPFEAQRIKSIPVPIIDQEDSVTWSRCRLGAYSVKTGYQLLCEAEMKAAPSSSNADEVKRFWKNIWRLKVPNKVRVFLWRACSNALPTKVNLQRRKVLDNSLCEQCKCWEEDVLHAIWSCETLREGWAQSFIEVKRKFPWVESLSDLVSIIIEEGKSLEEFVMSAWLIWIRRNKK